jgi:hypothetical protein
MSSCKFIDIKEQPFDLIKKNPLLQEFYIQHDLNVFKALQKNAISPIKRGIYGGAGLDIINYWLSTNATESCFVSGKITITEKIIDDFLALPADMQFLYGRKYQDPKHFTGFAEAVNIADPHQVIAALKEELAAIQVPFSKELFNFTDHIYPLLTFEARHPLENKNQTYKIYFVDADITKAASYPAFLTHFIETGIDCYYQRAGMKISEAYAEQNNFIEYLSLNTNNNAFFITDDHTEYPHVNMSCHFPVKTRIIAVEYPTLQEPLARSYDKHLPGHFEYGWLVKVRQFFINKKLTCQC